MIFLLQFSLILLIFVCPPLFVNYSDNLAVDFSKFSFFALISLILALFLYFQDRRERFSQGNPVQDNKKTIWKAAAFTSQYFLTFGSLVVGAVLFELLGLAIKAKSLENVILPSTFLQGLYCAFTLAAAAFYEECLYRLYLPRALKKILVLTRAGKKFESVENLGADEKTVAGDKLEAVLNFLAEGAVVLLFAFAHRYQGILALLNALLAGVILRLAFVKSKSLWPAYLAHLSFNAAALLFYANVNPIQ